MAYFATVEGQGSHPLDQTGSKILNTFNGTIKKVEV
jgi:hypothetical protein